MYFYMYLFISLSMITNGEWRTAAQLLDVMKMFERAHFGLPSSLYELVLNREANHLADEGEYSKYARILRICGVAPDVGDAQVFAAPNIINLGILKLPAGAVEAAVAYAAAASPPEVAPNEAQVLAAYQEKTQSTVILRTLCTMMRSPGKKVFVLFFVIIVTAVRKQTGWVSGAGCGPVWGKGRGVGGNDGEVDVSPTPLHHLPRTCAYR